MSICFFFCWYIFLRLYVKSSLNTVNIYTIHQLYILCSDDDFNGKEQCMNYILSNVQKYSSVVLNECFHLMLL